MQARLVLTTEVHMFIWEPSVVISEHELGACLEHHKNVFTKNNFLNVLSVKYN